MKKISLLVLLIFPVLLSKSQIKEKTYIVGGGLSLNFVDISHKESNSFNFSVAPNAGFMFTDAFGMGLSLQYSMKSSGDYKENNLGIGPYARYYFNKEMLSPFMVGIFEYNKQTIDETNGKVSNSYLGAAFGPGIAFFLNNHLSLEALLTYKHLVTKRGGGAYKNNNLDFIIGFQVYLPIENP